MQLQAAPSLPLFLYGREKKKKKKVNFILQRHCQSFPECAIGQSSGSAGRKECPAVKCKQQRVQLRQITHQPLLIKSRPNLLSLPPSLLLLPFVIPPLQCLEAPMVCGVFDNTAQVMSFPPLFCCGRRFMLLLET